MSRMDWRRRRLSIASIVLVVWLSGAHAASGLTIGAPQLSGTITNSTLDEISGLVGSRSLTDVFWVHNDSGDSARFFAMSGQGSLLGTFYLSGQSAWDWEDIAIGPQPGGGNYLFLGDIGDNAAIRSTITVHRATEPVAIAALNTTIASSNFRSLRLRYPGGPRDAEAMFVDPLSGDLFVLTKRLAVPELYMVPATAFDNVGQTVTMTALGQVPKVPVWATAADISPDGRFILVRPSNSAAGMLFERGTDQSIAEALQATGTPFQLGSEAQGESIGWAADGKSFFTTSEFNNGDSAPIYSYTFTAPPLLPGDYNNDQVVDIGDYVVWRNHFGTEFELPNEAESLGSVTEEDYAVWKANFGESLLVGGASVDTFVSAPEPQALLLVLFGILLSAPVRFKAWRR
jgi:hypothetical protein